MNAAKAPDALLWTAATTKLPLYPVAPPSGRVNRKYRLVVLDAGRLDDFFNLVVQQIGLPLDIDNQDGMADLKVQVLDRDDP